MQLETELKDLILSMGGKLFGFANMEGTPNCEYPVGISVAIPVPVHIVNDLKTAPTAEYAEMYTAYNNQLNEIGLACEELLKSKGFKAYAQTSRRVTINDDKRTALPHKTVATKAGLGWIGRNNLLVTREYGSAIRITSILTDAPLECAVPVTESGCGGCHLCVDACPAGALKNAKWSAGMERDEIVDVYKCYDKQLEIMKRETGIETDLCGKCFAVCAFTQKYLKSI